MDMPLKHFAFAGCLSVAAAAWASDPQRPLCAYLDAAKETAPTFAGAPDRAELSSQACAKLPGGAWGCELKFSDSCAGVERGSAQAFGKVFGGALDDAVACYAEDKGYARTNTEKVENEPGVRKRILREAVWTGPSTNEPLLVVSADVTQNYSTGSRDKQADTHLCSVVSITLRLENARSLP